MSKRGKRKEQPQPSKSNTPPNRPPSSTSGNPDEKIVVTVNRSTESIIVGYICSFLGYSGAVVVDHFNNRPAILYFGAAWACTICGLVAWWLNKRSPKNWKNHCLAAIVLVVIGFSASIVWATSLLVSAEEQRTIDAESKVNELRNIESAKSEFMTKMELAELQARFPLGGQIFTAIQGNNGPFAAITGTKQIPPLDKNKADDYLEFNWAMQGKASVGDGIVVLNLPVIFMEGKILPFLGNQIVIPRKTGASYSIDINPSDPNVFARGTKLNSKSQIARFQMSERPTISVVVEVKATFDETVVVILGVRPYDGR